MHHGSASSVAKDTGWFLPTPDSRSIELTPPPARQGQQAALDAADAQAGSVDRPLNPPLMMAAPPPPARLLLRTSRRRLATATTVHTTAAATAGAILLPPMLLLLLLHGATAFLVSVHPGGRRPSVWASRNAGGRGR